MPNLIIGYLLVSVIVCAIATFLFEGCQNNVQSFLLNSG